MRERVDLKSPVRENRPPGSVRGAPGNRRPYRDKQKTLAPPRRPRAVFGRTRALFRTSVFIVRAWLFFNGDRGGISIRPGVVSG